MNFGSLEEQDIGLKPQQSGDSEKGSNLDEWECVSEYEVRLDGMEDPFKEKWRNLHRRY